MTWSKKGKAREEDGLLPGRSTLGPLALMTLCPLSGIILWHILTKMDGSILQFGALVQYNGFLKTLFDIWPTPFDPYTWRLILTFMAFELILMKLVPGKPFHGPVTVSGNVPVYKANGVQCFIISVISYFLGAHFGLYNLGVIYDQLGHIISAMNVFSLLFCLMLYFKGRFAPSSSDCGITGNPVFDYYWGTELYPRILGWDVKLFTNCRCGMMFWALSIISYAFKQKEIYGEISSSMIVSVSLQLIYISKFYYWETGYLRTIDIMHDRAGFYICWGCLVWIPSVYTSPAMFLTEHPSDFPPVVTALMIAVGCLMIYTNYAADAQRQQFRAKNGKCLVWGKEPEFIVAEYTTESGKKMSSLLLTSGYWAISRHFHYVPEILSATMWSVPALNSALLPYFYVIFLAVLLTDRAFRDDARCSSKYGKHWNKYKERVPALIIPGII